MGLRLDSLVVFDSVDGVRGIITMEHASRTNRKQVLLPNKRDH